MIILEAIGDKSHRKRLACLHTDLTHIRDCIIRGGGNPARSGCCLRRGLPDGARMNKNNDNQGGFTLNSIADSNSVRFATRIFTKLRD